MKKADVQKVFNDFGDRVTKLFESRPYWLVQESLVRSELISAFLEQKSTFLPGDIDARHICTEATLGRQGKKGTKQAARFDLVVRPAADKTLIVVELKGWNIVTKSRDGENMYSSNATERYVADKIAAIGSDIDRLMKVSKQEPHAFCLLVVYAQEALGGEAAGRFAGRPDRPR